MNQVIAHLARAAVGFVRYAQRAKMHNESRITFKYTVSLCLLLLASAGPGFAADIPKKRCDEKICFANEALKKQHERLYDCLVKNKCSYAVDRVKKEYGKIPKSNPTYGFYRNQVCIADKACSNKTNLDSAKWLDDVVYDFIMPLVDEQGDWKLVKINCAKFVLFAHLQCQQLMAENHITDDLQKSVNKNGCGTKKDWDQIGAWLKDCIEAGIKDDNVINPFDIAATYASYKIGKEREKVRDACIADRESRGLNVEGK